MGGKGVQGAHKKHIKSCYTLEEKKLHFEGNMWKEAHQETEGEEGEDVAREWLKN